MDEIDIKLDNLRYILIAMLGALVGLLLILIQPLLREHRQDKIFAEYNIEMDKLHKEFPND